MPYGQGYDSNLPAWRVSCNGDSYFLTPEASELALAGRKRPVYAHS